MVGAWKVELPRQTVRIFWSHLILTPIATLFSEGTIYPGTMPPER